MARLNGKLLDTGDVLPVLTMETVSHGTVAVPDRFQDGWGVLLIYRAHW